MTQDSRWWIIEAAAFRDGIIDHSCKGITANDIGAYAIVLKGNEETELEQEGLIRYSISGADAGVFGLMKTISSDVRRVVRVLRSSKLRSRYAPTAGLRYDGL